MVPAQLNSPNTSCDRDVEGAKKLLDDAGYTLNGSVREKGGVPLVMYFSTSINPLRQGEQAIIKANLAEIGITVNLKAVDAGVFFSGDPGNPDTLNKMYVDIQMYTNGPSDTDPTSYLESWICDKVNAVESGTTATMVATAARTTTRCTRSIRRPSTRLSVPRWRSS